MSGFTSLFSLSTSSFKSVPSFLKVENGNIIGSHSVDKDLFASSYEYFLNMNKAEFKKEIYEVINSQP